MKKSASKLIHLRCSRLTLLILGMFTLTPSAWALSVKQCHLEASTPLEKTYCEILAKGQTLPNFYDFQRNPSATQRLLLSTPARKAGIALPSAAAKNNADTNLGLGNTRPTFNNSVPVTEERAAKKITPTTTQRRDSAETARDNSTRLDDCTLNEKEITCKNGRFFLAINVPLQRLNPRVLEDDNRLTLPNRRQGQTSLKYLSSLYPNYIEKMLLIGLGDSTMSFTKFAALYEQSQEKSENFGARFSEMYELLKKERKTMGIKTRYLDNYPQSIESCMPVSGEIITCDDVNQNWVYRRLSNS